MRRGWISGLVIVLSMGLDVLLPHQEHAIFWWHHVPAFAVLYGWLGCLALLSGAQWLGRTWLERDVADDGEERPCC